MTTGKTIVLTIRTLEPWIPKLLLQGGTFVSIIFKKMEEGFDWQMVQLYPDGTVPSRIQTLISLHQRPRPSAIGITHVVLRREKSSHIQFLSQTTVIQGGLGSSGLSVCICVLSCVRLFVAPRTVACQWDSPVKNTGVGSHSLLQGDLPELGIKRASLALAGRFFTPLSHQG